MQVTIEIPDDLAQAVVKIMQSRTAESIEDVIIMQDLGLSVEQFVAADHIVDSIESVIQERIPTRRR